MHGGVVPIIVLGIEGAGISSGPGGVVQAAVQLVYRSGAAGGQSAVRNHHVFWCVVDPLLLWHTGWWCRGQGAVAVYTAVRVP